MSSDLVVRSQKLSKVYRLYDNQVNRVKQWIVPPLQRWCRQKPTQFYRARVALDDVSFEIKKGESLGVIGRNGSGKSTLLQLIAGTLSPTSGAIEVNGRVASLLELGAGFHGEFTGRENVFLNGRLLGLDKRDIEDRFDDIAAFADIGPYLDRPVKTYSSGMYVRLAFAVVANVQADILIIDEALAVGDVFFAQKCMRFLRRFAEGGTIVFVSHDAGAILNLCARVLWLEDGHVRMEGPCNRVNEEYMASRYRGSLYSNESHPAKSDVYLGQRKVPLRDMRLNFINRTSLRNDIAVYTFPNEGRSFGTGGAKIVSARLLDYEAKHELSWIVGGEPVCVAIELVAAASIASLIVGFFIKDRMGQILFGENTFLVTTSCPISLQEGEGAVALFPFYMPILPKGSYAGDVAVADGTPTNHVQLQWIYDAFVLESGAASTSTGLIGIPFGKIEIRKVTSLATSLDSGIRIR